MAELGDERWAPGRIGRWRLTNGRWKRVRNELASTRTEGQGSRMFYGVEDANGDRVKRLGVRYRIIFVSLISLLLKLARVKIRADVRFYVPQTLRVYLPLLIKKYQQTLKNKIKISLVTFKILLILIYQKNNKNIYFSKKSHSTSNFLLIY